MTAAEVYATSDGEKTKEFYAQLETFGPRGLVALNLFRAQKCSTRAKLYRGRRFRDNAYERKQWSMGLLCEILGKHAADLGIVWGWKIDAGASPGDPNHFVLYVDLPQGQVSFHSPALGVGPAYRKDWDQSHSSPERIVAFCDSVLTSQPAVVYEQRNLSL